MLAMLLLLMWPRVRTWRGKTFERYTDAGPNQQQTVDSDVSSSTEMEISMEALSGQQTERKDVALIPSTAVMSDSYTAEVPDGRGPTGRPTPIV
jgi:hypothetical protein